MLVKKCFTWHGKQWTGFSLLEETLYNWHRESNWTPKNRTGAAAPGWVFCVQLGLRHTQARLNTKRNKNKKFTWFFLRKLFFLVLIIAFICRMPSWAPKLEPNGRFATAWFCFWCSTRLAMRWVKPWTLPPKIVLKSRIFLQCLPGLFWILGFYPVYHWWFEC